MEAWLEDDFHHFGVTIEHEGSHVRAVRVATIRYPWSTCAEAGNPLARLVGQPLITRASDLSVAVPMEFQCTHVFELAALAMTHAAKDRPERRYDAHVAPENGGACELGSKMIASLTQDDVMVLQWTVQDAVLIDPSFGAGLSLTKGFRQWINGMDDDQAEKAWILRRAAWLAFGDRSFRTKNVAAETGMGSVCHTFQPAQRLRALSMKNTRRVPGLAEMPLLSHQHEIP
jgi:hypothetical protein